MSKLKRKRRRNTTNIGIDLVHPLVLVLALVVHMILAVRVVISSDDDSTRKHKEGPKYSHKDKHLPKNLYFIGEGELTLDSFIFQFERIARNRE